MPVPSSSASPIAPVLCQAVSTHTTSGVISFPHICCGVTVTSESAWKRHVNGKKHAQLHTTAVTTTTSPATTPTPAPTHAWKPPRKCVVCDVKCPSAMMWHEHVTGSRHVENMVVAERAFKRGIHQTIVFLTIANGDIPAIDRSRIPSPPPLQIHSESDYKHQHEHTFDLESKSVTSSTTPHQTVGLETFQQHLTHITSSPSVPVCLPISLSYVPTLLDALASVPPCLRSVPSPPSNYPMICPVATTPVVPLPSTTAQSSLASSSACDVLATNSKSRSPSVLVSNVNTSPISIPFPLPVPVPVSVPFSRVSVVPVLDRDDDVSRALVSLRDSLNKSASRSERYRFYQSVESGMFIRSYEQDMFDPDYVLDMPLSTLRDAVTKAQSEEADDDDDDVCDEDEYEHYGEEDDDDDLLE